MTIVTLQLMPLCLLQSPYAELNLSIRHHHYQRNLAALAGGTAAGGTAAVGDDSHIVLSLEQRGHRGQRHTGQSHLLLHHMCH